MVEKRLPNLLDLDEASLDKPAILYHQCGRVCVVNKKALELAGVTNETLAPPGGAIDIDIKTGEVTGILRDNATDLVWKIIPELNEEEIMEATRLACEKITQAGITSMHWMVSSVTEIQIMQRLLKEKELSLRVYVVIPVNLLGKVVGSSSLKDLGGNLVRIGGVEIFVDGSLAARTAALYEPYNDEPTTKGTLLCTHEEMHSLVAKIHEAGLQPIIHAVGDQAVDLALTAIEESSVNAPSKNYRYRIEQAAVLNKQLIQRLRKERVIVSVQPHVIISEFSVWSADSHLGPERTRWLYPLKTLIKEGVKVIGGSDCPMEPLKPLLGIKAAVTRGFFPKEQITIENALRMYTIDAAYAAFEEEVKGTIEEGKFADFAVVSDDPRTCPKDKIGNIEVEMTIIGGKVVYPKLLLEATYQNDGSIFRARAL